MKIIVSFLLGLVTVLTLANCTRNQFEVKRLASPQIADSFSQVQIPAQATPQNPQGQFLRVRKEALGKIFLLVSSGTTGGPTPQWLDLKPQVVSFEKDFAGQKLALFAENYDSVYSEIQNKSLLQTFKIINEDADYITFDWASGLKSFVMAGVFDVDTPKNDPGNDSSDSGDADSAQEVMPVVDSFIRSLGFDQNNNLEINQVSQVRSTKMNDSKESVTREETLDMHVQIRPYEGPGSDFQPKKADPTRRAGFFVERHHKAQYSNTEEFIINKWDLSPSKGPITFLIPKSVPDVYVQAASEGALYWNKVYGREVIVVKTGVDTNMAPQHRSILLHWVSWMDSGAAYAQAQADPLTGEILRAQIFMPSVFTQVGSTDLVTLNGGSPVGRSPLLNNAKGCRIDSKLFAFNQLAAEATDSQRLRLAQDSVRSTIAHEAGHTMGLRHNFAASLSAKVSTEQILASAKTYLKDVNHPGLETVTSMMDYVAGIDDVLSSAYIKHDALSYDKMAISWSQQTDDKALDEKISYYCSDEDIARAEAKGKKIYGCERFDEGNNPLQRKWLNVVNQKNQLANILFASILSRLYPADGSPKADLKKVLADSGKWTSLRLEDLNYFNQVLFSSEQKANFVSLQAAKLQKFADEDQDDVIKQKISNDLIAAGGLSTMLSTTFLNDQGAVDVDWLTNQINAVMASPAFASGKTLAGRDYVLTNDEQALIANFLQNDLINANKTTWNDVLSKMSAPAGKSNFFAKFSQSEAVKITDFYVKLYSYSQKNQNVVVGLGTPTEVSFPVYYFEKDQRLQFVKWLTALGFEGEFSPFKYASTQLKSTIDKVITAASVNNINSAIPADFDYAAYSKIINQLGAEQRLDVPTIRLLYSELELLKIFQQLG